MAATIKPIERPDVWEEFIARNSPTAYMQSWTWGKVVQRLGHHLWRWGWYEGEELIAIAQIAKVSARRGTFLHIRHGPIVVKNWKRVLSDLGELAKREHAWFVRISPQVGKLPDLGLVPAPIHAMDAEICWVLDLHKPEHELFADMRKTTRYEIRRAQKLGVTVEETKSLGTFFELYQKTSERQRFVKHTGIAEEFEEMDARCLVASYEGKALASAIIVYFGDEAIYRHGASIPSKISASYLLQWEAIREAKKRGKKVYNFWGIAPDNKPNHPWRGLTLFKKGFGGREIKYIHAHDLPLSPLYIIPRTIETARKMFKGY